MFSWQPEQGPSPRRTGDPQPAENGAEGFGVRQGIPAIAAAMWCRSLAINLATGPSATSGNRTSRAAASRSSGEVGIPERIGRRRWRSHRQTGRSPKILAFARALGVSESVAERRVYGPEAVNLQAAKLIAVMILRGDVEDAATFEAPISAAMLGPVVEPMLDLQRSADESDGYEDVAQAAWIAERSDEALAIYVRKVASDLYHSSRLLAALKAEQAKRADK